MGSSIVSVYSGSPRGGSLEFSMPKEAKAFCFVEKFEMRAVMSGRRDVSDSE